MVEYNLEYLEELAAGDNNFLLSMIHDFITQTPDTLNQISVAIADNNYEQLYHLVHRFIPTLEYMGSTSIVQKFREIEQQAKSKEQMELINQHFNQAQTNTYMLIEKLKNDFNK